ncbi:MAG: hypothetical protein EON87_06395 [Brevundimonas sp.]|nr:MAG: hypothetical protein EON87_06395 [Brevundimonas sp.]
MSFLSVLTLFIVSGAQTPEGPPAVPPTCEALQVEAAALDTRIRDLQAQLNGGIRGVEQNARNGQAVAQAGQALGWATGLAGLVPGVGFIPSAVGAGVTQGAIEAQQRATTRTNQTLAEVVQELTPLGQRRHALDVTAAGMACPLPEAPAA